MKRRLLVPVLLLASTITPNQAMAVRSAELYRTQGYFYGRFEARVQYAPGSGVVSSFFLWKDGSSSSTLWNELDYEKLNADCRMQTNAWTGMGGVQHAQINAMPANICVGYHTYSFEWTPTYLAWFVDGAEIRRETGAIPADFTANASAGMKIHFNVWPGDASFGGTFSEAILPVHEYISWMQYSSYVNGAFQLNWREEFDGTGVPSGWAEGDWASPYGFSTHHPANVNFVNGIAVLSLTADGATGYTGTPPVDNAGTGGTGTGGTGTGGTGTGGAGKGGTGTGGAGKGGTGTGGAGKGGTGTGGAATGGATTGGSANRGGSSAAGGAESTTGGIVASTGGMAATGGATNAEGGALTGGAANSGGATANGGAATGGALQSSGGVVASSGGRTGSLSTGGGTSVTSLGGPVSSGGAAQGTAGDGIPADAGGCGCRVAGRSDSGLDARAFGLLTLLLARRRRGLDARWRSTRSV